MDKKDLKKMEDVELVVVQFEKEDVIKTSGECASNCGSDTCGSNEGDCLAKGTKIKMANGSLKNIEDIQVGDFIMTLNHETGKFVASKVHFVYCSEKPKCAFNVEFEDNTKLSIVGEHDLFEQESMKYVTLREENAETFIGKHFYNANTRSFVELTSVTHEVKPTDYYEIYTSVNMNCIANGMLNVADDVDYMLNIYEFDENLKANMDILAEDIKKYGLKKYALEAGYSKQEFVDWNVRYAYIVVGKGLKTIEEIFAISQQYLYQHEDSKKCA